MTQRDPLERFRVKRCPQCGYDLRGSAESDRCPECGFECVGLLVLQPSSVPQTPTALLVLVGVVLAVFSVWFVLAGGYYPWSIGLVALILAGLFVAYRQRRRHGVNRREGTLLVTVRGVYHTDGGAWKHVPWTAVRSGSVKEYPKLPEWLGRGSSTEDRILTLHVNSTYAPPLRRELNMGAGVLTARFPATQPEADALWAEIESRRERARQANREDESKDGP